MWSLPSYEAKTYVYTCINSPSHTTKIAIMFIYVKNLKNSSPERESFLFCTRFNGMQCTAVAFISLILLMNQGVPEFKDTIPKRPELFGPNFCMKVQVCMTVLSMKEDTQESLVMNSFFRRFCPFF